MAQFSRPQAGLFPTDGDDCGAYTADEWAPVLIASNRSGGMMVTGAAAPPGLPATQTVPNVGVYYATANRLEVASPAAAQISIATGVSIVDGRLHHNDTAITATPITIPAGGVNSRIDRVVVRMNYTGVDYTSVNAPALIVDFNTARIAIISGAEAVGPVAPTLTQDEDRATYWDIPLAQYEIIHTTGVISNLTDQREWVDAETKQLWIPAQGGWNTTDGTEIKISTNPVAGTPQLISVRMPNLKLSVGYGQGTYPLDYITDGQLTAVFLSGVGGGSAYLDALIAQGACGSPVTGFGGSVAWALYPVTASRILCAPVITSILDTLTPGAYFRCSARRDATAGTGIDTAAGDVDLQGFYLNYLGWGRR